MSYFFKQIDRWCRNERCFPCLLIIAVFLLFGPGHVSAQRSIPAPEQTRSVLITKGTVHVGDGRTIDEGAVGFRNGVIDFVGYAYGATAKYDTTIEASGQHIYPGFIAADTRLGLEEIGMVRASVDKQDVGSMEPELRSITAYSVDSRVIPTVRSNGVLLAQIAPEGVMISGSSSIVQLDAWDNDAATMLADDGVFLNWPSAYDRKGWWAEPDETDKKKLEERKTKLGTMTAFFQKAKAYSQDLSPSTIDQRLFAMRGLFLGGKTLFIRADAARDITEAVQFAKAQGVLRTVIVGGYDAWRVADLLRESKVDVVLRRLHSLPLRPEDDVDLPFRIPSLLKERGVRFCLGNAGDHEVVGLRNIPFLAGTASAYGLTSEEALRTITLDAAAVLGIDNRCGSLTVGKDATVIVSTGDALDMRTNNIVHAFIEGRRIVLDDHQKQLYRMYKDR